MNAMPVICIKANGFSLNGVKDEKYFIKRSSIYMDFEGTAYGELYEDNELTQFMANVRLDRFMSI